ncbi:MAG: carbon storage regulator [Planctomycetes bacterium]|nr:carbon storage regulator [Planctomycetota bacterium]
MLVLSRKKGERIRIGDEVVVTVPGSRKGKVRLGLEAPKDVAIVREEIERQPRDRPSRGERSGQRPRTKG